MNNLAAETELKGLREQILAASTAGKKLAICGGNTKADIYPAAIAEQNHDVDVLPVHYRGIVSYQASELVLTARAGTKLTELDAALAEKKQQLGFEPPKFGACDHWRHCLRCPVRLGKTIPRVNSRCGIRREITYR